MDREKVIKEYEKFVDKYECFSSSDDYVLEMHKAVLALLKEQEDGYKNILSDYEDLAREHEKLLDKKIPLITNGQEVVRCKDCKHILPKGFCHKHSRKVADDWFCADGERR